ncbi:MAG: hypothetical protein ACE144_00440 [Thermodesulfobacteriota bacterium]
MITIQNYYPRILIAIGGDVLFRNFVESGAFNALAQKYETYGFSVEGVRKGFSKESGIQDLGSVSLLPRREKIRNHLYWVSVFAGRSRSNTLVEKSKVLVKRDRQFYSAMSLPGVNALIHFVGETVLGTHPEIKQLFVQVTPDVVIVPSQGNDSLTVDLVKIARRRQIPVIALNYNWDNIASKGLMRYKPDILCVWGEDMAQLAVKVHRLRREQIKVIGAAHFEHYFDVRRMAAAAEGASRLIDQGIPRLLFAGNSKGHPEIPYLQLLETAIESGRLPRLKVIYRPHPWRALRRGEKNFYDMCFKHIEMDPQLAERYTPERMLEGHNRSGNVIMPALDYYPVLLQSVVGVISPFSTLLLETALVGRPILAMNMFEDDWLKHAADRFEHLHRFRSEIPGVLECDNEEAFIDRISDLLKMSENPGLLNEMREATRSIVYRDELTTYGERLVAVVDQLLSRRKRI